MKRIKLSFCVMLVVTIVLTCACASNVLAIDEDLVVSKHALVISAPFDTIPSTTNIDNSRQTRYMGQGSYNCMYNSFINNSIPTAGFVLSENDTYASFCDYIADFAESISENDLTYVYLHVHGLDYGVIELFGTNTISLLQLKNALDIIPGHIVFLFDSCFSGGAIATIGNFNQLQISNGYGCFRTTKYTVFCSCKFNQESWTYNNNGLSFCAESWAWAMGQKITNKVAGSGPFFGWSTAENFGIRTAAEFFDISSQKLPLLMQDANQVHYQVPVYYSASDYYSVLYTQYQLGDVFTNNIIDSSDVLRLRAYILGSVSLSSTQQALGDLNRDGQLTMTDVNLLQSHINAMTQ